MAGTNAHLRHGPRVCNWATATHRRCGYSSRCTRRLRSLETGRTAVFKPGAQRTFHDRGGEQILHVVRSRASRAHAGPACDVACQRARSDAIKGRKYLRGARTAATSQKRNVSTILAVSGSLAASEYDFRAAYGERACGITEARVSVQREGQRRMQQREAGGGGRYGRGGGGRTS
ncbi:hypothetical protein K466DRAFT_74940 [Polyporus arcularius HHB13444]|uniref:Uncharacterized protein n=1 Tax=Polyporus arcularius HHB13444 TaxID=1314778 RepID=A0A5C3PJK5_9APHY|nr:hypothetical protein K466DRAFT_74940 [Polyporus arcularius HHB13444]